MDWYWILLIVIASLFLLLGILVFVLVHYFVHFLTYPARYSRDYCLDVDLEKKVISSDVLAWKQENLLIPMDDHYLIHGTFYPGKENKLVIFAHGYTWTREGSLKYAKLFHRLGYSLYLYDERGHGDNRRVPVTLGYQESKDLHQIIRYFRTRYGESLSIGLHGESMGAAVVLLEMKHKEDHLSFVIADSPFASMKKLMEFQMKSFHLPFWIADWCNPVLKHQYGFTYSEVEPIECVKQSMVPLLLIQGNHDTLIPPEHTKEIYCARKEKTTLKYFPNVDHTESYQHYPEEYEATEIQFLSENHLLDD